MLIAFNRRIVIATISALIIIGVYFSISNNNYIPKFSDINPPSGPSCLNSINKVNCIPNSSTTSKESAVKILEQQKQANYALKKGIALEQLGHMQEAIKYYEKAMLLQPTNSDLLVRNGDALTKIKNYTGAIGYYEEVLARQPSSIGSTGIIENIGNDLYNLGKYEEAIKYYNKALVVEPTNPDLLINKANALFHTGNYSGAIKYYDKALTFHLDGPAITSVMINKGLALRQLANYSGAKNVTQKH
jgi:tetratricopeptide (TPR) repeat protein